MIFIPSCWTTPTTMKSGLIRGMASLEGNNLVVFYHLSASDIWPDKIGSLWTCFHCLMLTDIFDYNEVQKRFIRNIYVCLSNNLGGGGKCCNFKVLGQAHMRQYIVFKFPKTICVFIVYFSSQLLPWWHCEQGSTTIKRAVTDKMFYLQRERHTPVSQ